MTIQHWGAMAAAGLAGLLNCVTAPGWAVDGHVYREAPVLAAEVEAGRLPAVEQRLPENPMLVEPLETIGSYGGAWRMAIRQSFDHASLIRTVGYENLMRWTPDWTGTVPNVAQSVAVNGNATEFTFALRRGLRWSDGTPFTADDILFWYEDVLLNKELTPSIPFWLLAANQPVEVTKLDDFKVVFRFATPNSLFLEWLSAPEGAEPTSYPKQYLAQFLPRYNKNLDGAAWVDAFRTAFGIPGNIDDATRWQHPAVPTLNAWLLTGAYGEADPLVATRNPYYWKVDPAGQQLPYIDRISFAVVDSKRAAAELAMRGGIDMQTRHVRCCADEVLAASNDYTPIQMITTETNELLIGLNLNHPDRVLRELFNQRDFRIALSIGMDRAPIAAELNGTPWQPAPLPQSRHYNERLATQYLEFDPAAANRLLDGLGLDQHDDSGRRLLGDGRPVAFKTICYEGRCEALTMVTAQWRALGIEVTPEGLEREDYVRRVEANDFDAAAPGGDGGIDPIIYAQDFLPLGIDSTWGIPWWYWYQNPTDPRATEPPPPVRRQFELFELIKATADPTLQHDLMRQILEIAADEFYVIGVFRGGLTQGIVRRGFRNVPDIIMSSWSYPDPAPTNPAQYFMELPQ